MRLFILFTALTLFTLPALADRAPEFTRLNNRCNTYKLCDAYAGTTECTSLRDADEIVLELNRKAAIALYSTESAGNYSCDVYTSTEGFDAATATDQVNTTSISDEAPVLLIQGVFEHLWIKCPTNDATDVTIDALVCPLE
jgi:hypothetical protein